MQDGRVLRNIFSTSSIQSDVWDHPREADRWLEGGIWWRKSKGGLGEEGDVRRDQLLTLMLLGQIKALLFSLHSLVSKLKEADVGVMCRGQLISALLYADDAEGEELMRRGLDILAEWCEEWSVKVNVEKCGVIQVRRKGVKRSDERFHVAGEEIKVVEG